MLNAYDGIIIFVSVFFAVTASLFIYSKITITYIIKCASGVLDNILKNNINTGYKKLRSLYGNAVKKLGMGKGQQGGGDMMSQLFGGFMQSMMNSPPPQRPRVQQSSQQPPMNPPVRP